MNEMQKQVEEFHREMGLTVGAYPAIRDAELRARLILEEAIETAYALLLPQEHPEAGMRAMAWVNLCSILARVQLEFGASPAPPEARTILAIDGICDSLYVLFGTAVAMGIDVEPFFDEVHRANMTKTGGGMDEGGKVLKPEGWIPPNIAGVRKRLSGVLKKTHGAPAPDLDGDLVPPPEWQHVAMADDSDDPFDWTDHTESSACRCGPRVDPPYITHRREPVREEEK